MDHRDDNDVLRGDTSFVQPPQGFILRRIQFAGLNPIYQQSFVSV